MLWQSEFESLWSKQFLFKFWLNLGQFSMFHSFLHFNGKLKRQIVWMMVGLAGFEPRVAGWKMRANPLNYGCPQSEQFLLHANLFKSTWKRDWGWPPFRIERKTLKRKIVWQHFCPFRNILFRERILTRFPKIWTFFRSKLKSVFFRLNILQNCWDRKTSFITSRIAKTLN